MSRCLKSPINHSRLSKQRRQFVKTLGVLTGLACLAHLFIGADPVVVAIAGLTFMLSICPVAMCGFFNIGAVLIGLVGFRYVGFSIFAKLAMGQPLSSNLLHARGAFLVVLVGVVGYLVAFACAYKLNVGRPISRPVNKEMQLGRISLLAGALGVTAALVHFSHVDRAYRGTHVVSFFVNLIDLALICAFARNILRSRRQIADWWVWLLAGAVALIVLISSSRGLAVAVLMCFVATKTAFGTKIDWRVLCAGAAIMALVVMLVTPVFLYVRGSRTGLTLNQFIGATWRAATDWHGTLSRYLAQSRLQEESQGWFLRYYGSRANILTRLSLVNHVEVLKNGSDSHGRFGLYDLCTAFEKAVPRILAPNKPRGFSQGDWLYATMGIPTHMGGHSTAPLIGEGYAGFGWPGAFCYPFLMGFAMFLFIKKISGWDLRGNVLAIFLLICIQNSFVEGDSSSYIIGVLRILPQDLVLMWLMTRLSAVQFIGPLSRRGYRPFGRRPPVQHPHILGTLDRRLSSGRS
jgi:hypothetical protein